MMGMGPRTNLYNIGGDPLTQLNFVKYIKKKKIFIRNADSDEINRKYFVGEQIVGVFKMGVRPRTNFYNTSFIGPVFHGLTHYS